MGQLNRSIVENVKSRNPYRVRNADLFNIVKSNTELYRDKSYLPKAIRLWNNLDVTLKNVVDVEKLKWLLKPKFDINPMYLVNYTRKASIEQCRLRCGNSNLNRNLFNILLSDTLTCECGNAGEDDSHYFYTVENTILYELI